MIFSFRMGEQVYRFCIPADPTGCDKSTRRVKFRFFRRANHPYNSRHPVLEEGALAIVTERWDGIAVDAKASCAERDCRAG